MEVELITCHAYVTVLKNGMVWRTSGQENTWKYWEQCTPEGNGSSAPLPQTLPFSSPPFCSSRVVSFKYLSNLEVLGIDLRASVLLGEYSLT